MDRRDNQQDRRDNQLDRRDHRADRVTDRQQYQQNRLDRRNDVRGHYRNYPAQLPRYGAGYWGAGNWRWGWQNQSNNWWAFATAGAVTGWLANGTGGSQPVYYDYGDNYYYEGDTVYHDGQPVASAEEYATQAQQIAANIPDVEPASVEWMPLGVFALTDDADQGSGADPTMFLQLAISKEGIIAGSFQNTATDKTSEVEGTIDVESQRAAFGMVGQDWPIMETGIYNLTQDDASALLHFADGQTQKWLMVRLEEPSEPAGK